MVAGETAVQDLLTGVDEQMEAVGDLFGVRSAQRGTHCIVTAAIPAHHPYLRMLAYPPRKSHV
jgi:hypothetical protein